MLSNAFLVKMKLHKKAKKTKRIAGTSYILRFYTMKLWWAAISTLNHIAPTV